MKRLVFISALLASAAAFAASAPTARFGDLGMNAQVVTNVDFSGLAVEETDPSFSQWTNGTAVLYGPLKLHQSAGGLDTSVEITTNGVSGWKFSSTGYGAGYWVQWGFDWYDVLTSESDPTVSSWAKQSTKPSYTWSEISSKPTFATVATSGSYNDLSGKPSIPSAASIASISQSVATVVSYLQGDDAKVVITNYDSASVIPSASFQQKISEGGTNYWKTIWNELARWNWFLPIIRDETNALWNALGGKADCAWGFYESHTGEYAPDDYTWISSPKIAIAGGLAYRRTVTSEGAVWVLESNGLVTETGGVATNGYFKIADDEGNQLFSIVKGNKRTVGADASGCSIVSGYTPTKIQITYSVASDAHPTLYICESLSNQVWKAETDPDCIANVSWPGNTSGAYVAQVQGKTALPSMFVKAEYEVGGETYIKNVAPISADGGILCTDGIHKVRPVYNNGTVTWEVVQ